MARGRGDEENGSETQSVLGLVGVGESRAQLVRRRALLFGVPAAVVTAGVFLAVAQKSENDGDDRHSRLSPGPATVRTPGTLAGPSATPAWSVRLADGANAIAMAAGTLLLVDGFGNVRGVDPQTGVEKWQPSVRFFSGMRAPLLVVGDTLYGYDADGDLLAVEVSNGTPRWQVQFASSGVDIATVAGSAGPLVFSTGSIEGQAVSGRAHGLLWAVNTTVHGVAWNLDNVDYNLAVAASDHAGVVVTADEIEYRLTAYSLKDQSVQWTKDAGNAGQRFSAPISPAACVAVSGDTFYWGADQLYALDAATGEVRWTGGSANPADEFQSVLVLPGQGRGAELVVATATGSNGGTLHAFRAADGVTQWVQHAGGKFGQRTALAAAAGSTGGSGGSGVLYAAEDDSGSLFAVDADSGQTRWTYHDSTATTDMRWSVAADDTRVYVAYGNKLLAFEH